jgi:hypothetical protein
VLSRARSRILLLAAVGDAIGQSRVNALAICFRSMLFS